MYIVIKPHHLLDIFKLYGKGLEKFIPDVRLNHDFYFIGNAVLENKVNKVKFTYGFDDICKPCDYLKDTVCIGEFEYDGAVYKKNSYNEKLDIRLVNALGLEYNKTYEFNDIVKFISERLNFELINSVWSICSLDDNTSRYLYTKKGMDKYIQKISG